MAQAEAPSKPIVRGNFTVTLSAGERSAMEAAAERSGVSLAQFIREAGTRRAEKLGCPVAE
jgi:predicted HicB family RNase H-like nuclease